MPEETKSSSVPKDLYGFLDYYLVKKAPFQIPEGGKEWIVKYGPWIDLVLLVLLVPVIFATLGLSTLMAVPYAVAVNASFGFMYWTSLLVLIAQLGLQVAALPGLFARKMSGWTLLFYSQVVAFVSSLVTGNVVGALVGVVIGLYVLFQIRSKYTK